MDELAQISALLGVGLRWQRRLSGGEQNGAQLVTDAEGRMLVVKVQAERWKADRVLQAAPALAHAASRGWPVARWLRVGRLASGAAFVVQQYVPGRPVTRLDAQTMQAILAANDRQAGLAHPDAFDDSAQLKAVLGGECDWKAAVARHTPAGETLVRHGDAVLDRAGPVGLPGADVVHGDYSTTNMQLSDQGQLSFVDCESVGRGTRVRDLADLFRQCFVYPGASATALEQLRSHAYAIAGPRVFATCVVAVSYNNLAWWVENKPPAEFDSACRRVHGLFDALEPGR